MLIQDWDDTTVADLVGTLPRPEPIPEEHTEMTWLDAAREAVRRIQA